MEENTAKKMVVELIGGVGTGKSRVLDILKEDYQAVVIQADEVAKHLEEKGQAGLIKLTEAFGTGILDSEGNLDRTAFAEESIPGSRGFGAGQRHHSSPGLELDLQKGLGDPEGTGDCGNCGSG